MYVLVYTPSLLRVLRVFHLPESVQKNLSKSNAPRKPQIICPATWRLFPGPLYDGTYTV